MSTRQNTRRTYDRYETERRSSAYVYGSAAPEIRREVERRPNREARPARRPAPEARPASVLPRLIATMMVIAVLMGAFINYVSVLSDRRETASHIAQLEREIKVLSTSNNQLQEENEAAMDLDEIKYIAIHELGMKYADEDQVVYYELESDDYVRQVRALTP